MDPAEQGSSLVEVMVGAMVALIIVGAVLSIVVRESHLRRSNTETSMAIRAAVNNLEQVRTVDETTLVSLDGTGFDVLDANGNAGGLPPVPGDMDGLPGLLTVVQEENTGGVRIYRVVATVAWKGSAGTRRIRLQSLVGERK